MASDLALEEAGLRRYALSPEDAEFLRTDLDLRREAVEAYPATAQVVALREGHPERPTLCESCHHVGIVTVWCGVRLCIPCWHKQSARSMGEIAGVLRVCVKRRREAGLRPGLRFVTLTLRSGPSLAFQEWKLLRALERLRRFAEWGDWVEGGVLKLEVTRNEATGEWHVHAHLVVSGRFIPHGPNEARHSQECRRATEPLPARSFCPPGCEPNLRDAWRRATADDGEIVDVREVDTRDSLSFAKEMAKYVAKPFAESSGTRPVPLEDWPEAARLELATWIAGGTRVKWHCPSHREKSRRACLRLSSSRWECEGRYRREAVGARRLRWYGTFRTIHRELRAGVEGEEIAASCPKCGKGPTLSCWEVNRRIALGWSLPDGVDPSAFDRQLPSIQAHKPDGRQALRVGQCASVRTRLDRWVPPTGGAGPPPGSRGPSLIPYRDAERLRRDLWDRGHRLVRPRAAHVAPPLEFTPGSFLWATAGCCIGCSGRWREGQGKVSCPHRGERW